MTLMVPTGTHHASAIAPRTMRRAFRLQLRCSECHRETETELELLDEVGEPAVEEDFYASGAINRLEYRCDACSCENVTILRVGYVRQPIDLLRPDNA